MLEVLLRLAKDTVIDYYVIFLISYCLWFWTVMTSLKRRVFTKNLSESFGAEVWVISAIFWKIHMERTILANYLEVTGRKAEVYYTNNNLIISFQIKVALLWEFIYNISHAINICVRDNTINISGGLCHECISTY